MTVKRNFIHYIFLIILTNPASRTSQNDNDGHGVNSGLVKDTDKMPNVSENILRQIRFFVYSTSMEEEGVSEEIKIGDSATLTDLNKNFQYKIMTHGFMGECDAKNYFPAIVIRAYVVKGFDYNLICVDWGPLSNRGGQASMLLYESAVGNAIIVGKRVAELVKYLMEEEMANRLEQFHLIGFSLGAHVAGITGHFIKNIYGKKVARITGLDPAGPFFDESKPFDHKLDQNDAECVDIIHTDAGKLGISKSIGHLDFYPNGGRRQPQCGKTGNLTEDLKEAITGLCSHRMAPKYFALSILEPGLLACKCTSWKEYSNSKCECTETIKFGQNCKSNSSRGNYYLKINAENADDGNKSTVGYKSLLKFIHE